MVYGVRNFLPRASRALNRAAASSNLSSIFGIISPAGQTDYCASKFAVRGFTEALMHELEMTGNVGFTCRFIPAGINTPISRNSRLGAHADAAVASASRISLRKTPRAALRPPLPPLESLSGIKRGGEPRVLIGKDAIQLDRMQRLFPRPLLGHHDEKPEEGRRHGGFQPAARKVDHLKIPASAQLTRCLQSTSNTPRDPSSIFSAIISGTS